MFFLPSPFSTPLRKTFASDPVDSSEVPSGTVSPHPLREVGSSKTSVDGNIQTRGVEGVSPSQETSIRIKDDILLGAVNPGTFGTRVVHLVGLSHHVTSPRDVK